MTKQPTKRNSRKGRPGIPKYQGYATRIFSAEYDLLHMLIAYGKDNIHDFIEELAKGNLKQVSKEMRQMQNALAAQLDPRNSTAERARWIAHLELNRG